MVVPGATGYYIIDRPPSSRVPISCRDPCRSPGTAGLRVNLCTSAAEKKNVYRHISITDRVSLQTFSSLSPLPQFDHAHASANIYRGRVPLPLPIVVSRRNNCWSAYAIRYATVTYSKYITYYSIITYLLLRSTFRITFFIFNVPYFTSKKKKSPSRKFTKDLYTRSPKSLPNQFSFGFPRGRISRILQRRRALIGR